MTEFPSESEALPQSLILSADKVRARPLGRWRIVVVLEKSIRDRNFVLTRMRLDGEYNMSGVKYPDLADAWEFKIEKL